VAPFFLEKDQITMMTHTQQVEHDTRVAKATAYMRRHKVSAADLTEIGGAGLKSSDASRAAKARAVGRTWALMASLHVAHADLDARARTL
jgi:hypothetical protein